MNQSPLVKVDITTAERKELENTLNELFDMLTTNSKAFKSNPCGMCRCEH